MKKKAIALMFLIPLLLIFSVFNAAENYSLVIDVAAGGVKLECAVSGGATTEDGFVFLDMAKAGQALRLLPHVTPENAKNKNVIYTQSQLSDEPLGEVEIDENGVIRPIKAGTVIITVTTADGGYTDRVILKIAASLPSAITINATSHIITDGKISAAIGQELSLSISSNATSQIDNMLSGIAEWKWLNGKIWDDLDNCIDLKEKKGAGKGVFSLVSKGEVKLRASLPSEYSATGEALHSEVTVNISDSGRGFELIGDGIFNKPDSDDEKTLGVYSDSTEFDISIIELAWETNFPSRPISDSAQAFGENAEYDTGFISVNFVWNSERSKVSVTVSKTDAAEYRKEYKIKLKLFDKEVSLDITFFEEATAEDLGWKKGTEILTSDNGSYKAYAALSDNTLALTLTSGNVDITDFSFNSSNTDIISIKNNGRNVMLTLKKEGTAVINATVTVFRPPAQGGNYELAKEITVEALKVPSRLEFKENNKSYGIAQKCVLGEKTYNPDYSLVNYEYGMELMTDAEASDLEWSSEDLSIARVDGGRVSTVGNGTVKITAVSRKAVLTGKTKVRAEFTFVCAKDAVNVSSYGQLIKASSEGREIALRNSIGSAYDIGKDERVKPFYVDKGEIGRLNLPQSYKWYNFDTADDNKVVAFTKQTATSDLQYNRNLTGITTKNDISVGIVFKNGVHGNGYFLNADNLVRIRKDNMNSPIFTYNSTVTGERGLPVPFNGPVHFVSATVGDNTHSVYGQDNVGFFVQGKNVCIDNIQLQNRNDGVEDLTELDYSGTTLEFDGTGHFLTASRAKLGRTVLRVFSGDANDFNNDNKTSLTVDRCILGQSREFTVRIGANKVKKYSGGEMTEGVNKGPQLFDYLNPTRFDEVIPQYQNVDEYNDELLNNSDYNSQVIKTTVTIRNSVLERSGLFAIAMDSHFAGWYLNNKSQGYGWKDCAGTSYGATLTLEGQVRMYEWKRLDSINSASLVGLSSGDNPDPFGMTSLISKYNADYQILISREEEGKKVDYAHGGIAFFGGGRNYSLIDNRASDDIYRMPTEGVCVGIGEITLPSGNFLAKYLHKCAGDDRFRFYLFKANSDFNLDKQRQDYYNGSAYKNVLEIINN